MHYYSICRQTYDSSGIPLFGILTIEYKQKRIVPGKTQTRRQYSSLFP